jgi:ABC-2 type transport system ATP-binding protein
VLGADPATFSARERGRIGYMPQIPVLFPHLTLWANLNFVASVYGVPHRHRRSRLLDLLKFVDLVDDRHKLLSESSGGMQRRLTLAATLVHRPELVILDEPTAGIDPILRERFWNRFRDLRDSGVSLVVSTQYVGEAAMCDHVAVMTQGRLIALDTPEGLRQRAFGGEWIYAETARGWVSNADLAALRALPFVVAARHDGDGMRVTVQDAARDLPQLTEHFRDRAIEISALEPVRPTYDEVFVALVEAEQSLDRSAA